MALSSVPGVEVFSAAIATAGAAAMAAVDTNPMGRVGDYRCWSGSYR